MTMIPWGSDLAARIRQFGPLDCVTDKAGSLDFNTLGRRAAGLARLLLERGVTPGEPVATCLRNSVPAVWASYGVCLSGAAETPLNPAFTPEERRYCLDLAGIRRVVTSAAERDFFTRCGVEAVVLDEIPEADGPAALDDVPAVPGEAWGRITFTSGTTGRPKAIIHTHQSRWIANILQRASFPRMPGPGNRVLLMTPFTHGAALLTYGFLDMGAEVVLLEGVDVEQIRPLLFRGEVDHVFAPPTVLAKLTAAFDGTRIEGVQTIFCGTATLTPALYARAREMFGPVVRITYGKSEIVNPITVLPQAACDAYYATAAGEEGACVGWPASGVEVAIRSEDDAAALSPGEIGEVHLRGCHMLAGQIDASGFHPLPDRGFHATGDLGRIDAEGRLHLIGRTADVIKSGGYKIYPAEIENALALASGGGAVVAATLPSDYWGEVIIAVAEAPSADWESRAREFVAALARFKHPRAYVALPELPRNAQGKIPRPKVREMVLQRYRLVDGPYPALEPL